MFRQQAIRAERRATSALWGLWKLRNCLCFQNGQWRVVKHLLQKIAKLVRNWKLLCPDKETSELDSRSTWQICKLAGPLKDDLFSFLGKYGGNWEENQVAKKLAHLLSEGRVANFLKKLSHEEGCPHFRKRKHCC
jgi:hypothetical protein